MATLSEWMNRLRYLGRRSRFDDDLEVELRFHIESRTAELIASGVSPRDAATRARAEFGSIARAVEDSRAAWQFRWIEDLAADLRYGFRAFRRSPGFAVTAVLSLALGIGANAAIFNALYSVLWKPLPVSKPEELVKISLSSNSGLRDLPTVAFVGQLRSAGVFEGVSVRHQPTASAFLMTTAPNVFWVKSYLETTSICWACGPSSASHSRQRCGVGAGRRKRCSRTVSGSGGSAVTPASLAAPSG